MHDPWYYYVLAGIGGSVGSNLVGWFNTWRKNREPRPFRHSYRCGTCGFKASSESASVLVDISHSHRKEHRDNDAHKARYM